MEPITDNDFESVLDSYFNRDNVLVQHQINSFNAFINYDLKKIINQFSPYSFLIEKDTDSGIEDVMAKNIRYFKTVINFEDIKIIKPNVEETNGKEYQLYPNDARNSTLTYQSSLFIKVSYDVILLNKNREIIKTLSSASNTYEKIGNIPIMLKSDLCNLKGLSPFGLQQVNEDPFDYGGYFIIKGNEKVIIPQEKRNENHIFVFKNPDGDFPFVAEVKSERDDNKVNRNVNIKLKYVGRSGIILVQVIPGFSQNDIPISVIFRALGIITDKDIAEHIVWDLSNKTMLEILRPSLEFCKEGKNKEKIKSQSEALLYIGLKVIPPHQRFDNDTERKKYVMNLLDKYLFPHIIDNDIGIKRKKARYLGLMCNKLLLAKLNKLDSDDRDDIGNKRIDTTGTLFSQLLRYAFSNFLDTLKRNIRKEFISKTPTTNEAIDGLFTRAKNIKLIDSPIKSALSTGQWRTSKNSANVKIGVAQILQRKSRVDALANLRRIFTPTTGGNASSAIAAIRRLHNSQYGYIDPLDTPEGAQTGVVKNIAMTCDITIKTTDIPVIKLLESLEVPKIEDIPFINIPKMTIILVNGVWYGATLEPKMVVDKLREARRKLQLDLMTSIVRDFQLNEIQINTDGGRPIRPIYRVIKNGTKKQKLLMNKDILGRLTTNNLIDKWNWNELVINNIIEYIDVKESEHNCVIAKYPSDIYKADAELEPYTHCEIHPMTMLGPIIALSPFTEHNQSPRNLFQASMGKQAMNVYATNFPVRMDTAANVLHYPQRPLVTTYAEKMTHFNKFPAGINAMVAIAMYSGYNQEDSVIINRSSLERGLFVSSNFKSFKDEAKGEDRFCKPDPERTQNMKAYANYDKLNKYGIVPVGTYVVKNDVLIGKVSVLDRNQKIGNYDQSDNSTIMKEAEGYVDKIITDKNDDGYEVYKVKVRLNRVPKIGDKFCYSDDTEVLTDSGWIFFKDLTYNHKVAAIINDGKNIQYETPSEIVSFEHKNEDMYEIDTKYVSLCVTLNHKLYAKLKGAKNKYGLIEAEKTLGKNIYFKKTALFEGKEYKGIKIPGYTRPDGRKEPSVKYPMDEFLTFLGLYITEGYSYQSKNSYSVRISANKQRVKEELQRICPKLGIIYRIDKGGTYERFDVNNKRLYNFFSKIGPHAKDKYIPKFAFKLSVRQSKILLEALICGDGNFSKRKDGSLRDTSCAYSTSSKQLLNDFTRLCTHVGWTTCYTLHRAEGTAYEIKGVKGTSNSDCFKVSVVKTGKEEVGFDIRSDRPCYYKIIKYTGKVYCCTTSSGILMVRRNTRPILSGNSSRSSQKGIAGMLYHESDMPYNELGITPDIIINPQAIPSRMTIAQIMECVCGKAGAMNGNISDGTAFTGISYKDIVEELKKTGFSEDGTEVLYNGFTGEKMEAKIFMGPTYYQRLKHVVEEKMHSRATGSVQMLTRQPLEGRARDGGLRFGKPFCRKKSV